MQRSSTNHPAGASIAKALWANCIVLVVIAVVLLSRNDAPRIPGILPAAYGQQAAIGGGAGVFLVPGQFSTNTYGCYLMDIDAQTICAYQFYPADKQLRLTAARNFKFDRRLKNFNSPSPSWDEVQGLLERESDANRVKEQNNTPAPPEQK